MRLAATALAFLAIAAPAAAKPGDLDWRTAFAGGEGYSDASDVALDRAGRVLVAGDSLGHRVAGGFLRGPTLARLTRAGRVDRGYGRAGLAVLPDPRGVAIHYGLPDEKVVALPGGAALVATTLGSSNSLARIVVYRVGVDGRLDPGFGIRELALPDAHLSVADIGLEAGGRIVIAALRGTATAPAAVAIRLRPDGTTESQIAVAAGLIPDALLVQPGRTLIAGHRPGGRGRRARAVVYALDAQGQVRRHATLVLRSARRAGANVVALAPDRRGALLIAGNDGDGALPDRPWVARLRRDGRLDFKTSPAPRRLNIEILAMARDHHGRIVLAGAERTLDDVGAVLRLTPSGRRDRRFGRAGVVLKQIGARPNKRVCCSEARAVAIDARDRIVVAGVVFDADASREDLSLSYFAVARLKG